MVFYENIINEGTKENTTGNLTFRNGKDFIFVEKSSKEQTQISSKKIKKVFWIKEPRYYVLKFHMTDGLVWRFSGFDEKHKSSVKDNVYAATDGGVQLKVIAKSVRGENWFNFNIFENDVEFNSKDEPSFDIPFEKISQHNLNRNEEHLKMNINPNDDIALSDIRIVFFSKPSQSKMKGSEKEVNEEEIENDIEVEEEEISWAEKFHEKIATAVFSTENAEHICEGSFNMQTPRGVFQFSFTSTGIDLHGRSHNYKIEYKNMQRFFLLPNARNRQMLFVINLEDAIRQGNTPYPFLVIVFAMDNGEPYHLELNLTDAQIKNVYQNKLQREMVGEKHEVLGTVLSQLAGRRIETPSIDFNHESEAIACIHRTSNGFLYPMEKAIIYMPKPIVLLQFNEIKYVEFIIKLSNHSMSMRLFDLTFFMKSGQKYVFIHLASDVQDPMKNFFSAKNISVKIKDETKKQKFTGEDLDLGKNNDDDDDDDDSDDPEDKDFSEADVKSSESSSSEDEDNENEESDDDDDDDENESNGDDIRKRKHERSIEKKKKMRLK
ncbi:hypothetical protein SNEBB_006131 [Seison nebaliae]|nr:hypothetical protein SNEBB_006131 [Seison nebaliae]